MALLIAVPYSQAVLVFKALSALRAGVLRRAVRASLPAGQGFVDEEVWFRQSESGRRPLETNSQVHHGHRCQPPYYPPDLSATMTSFGGFRTVLPLVKRSKSGHNTLLKRTSYGGSPRPQSAPVHFALRGQGLPPSLAV
jgi:hypothetical protein